MATLPAALTDDLIEEFFLRLSPEDPTSLLHAALVCKRWRRIIADCGFCRRFCEHHHQRPPLLGYLGYGPTTKTMRVLFTPTSSFRPRIAGLSFMEVINSHHGRVLISHKQEPTSPMACRLSVWDPIKGDLLNLPRLPQLKPVPSVSFTWDRWWSAPRATSSAPPLPAATATAAEGLSLLSSSAHRNRSSMPLSTHRRLVRGALQPLLLGTHLGPIAIHVCVILMIEPVRWLGTLYTSSFL